MSDPGVTLESVKRKYHTDPLFHAEVYILTADLRSRLAAAEAERDAAVSHLYNGALAACEARLAAAEESYAVATAALREHHKPENGLPANGLNGDGTCLYCGPAVWELEDELPALASTSNPTPERGDR